jgi:hypothetical protein
VYIYIYLHLLPPHPPTHPLICHHPTVGIYLGGLFVFFFCSLFFVCVDAAAAFPSPSPPPLYIYRCLSIHYILCFPLFTDVFFFFLGFGCVLFSRAIPWISLVGVLGLVHFFYYYSHFPRGPLSLSARSSFRPLLYGRFCFLP